LLCSTTLPFAGKKEGKKEIKNIYFSLNLMTNPSGVSCL
jgi:hypothetical protein